MNERERMVEEIKQRYGLKAPSVFSAMLQVEREKFIAKRYSDIAYRDGPIPIGHSQTMSQPYTVAFMTDLLISDKQKETSDKAKEWKVLEIGTGSGYQAAVLSHLAKKVYSVEIIRQLAERAKKRLKKLGYKNVHVRSGSGEWGWREKAPFDAIMVTAGIEKDVPLALLDQLKEGGVLVAPIGRGHDKVMTKFTKLKKPHSAKALRGKRGKEEIKKEEHGIFHFVPFVRESS